jgi:hypothetical protein
LDGSAPISAGVLVVLAADPCAGLAEALAGVYLTLLDTTLCCYALLTVAAIDRIIHHATILEIDGDSYRRKHQKRS